MTKRTLFIIFGLFIFFSSCAEVNYIGQTYEPTTEVEIFFDEKLIEYEYTIIGHAIGSGAWGISNEKIQDKLIQTARKKGAHAIIITGVGKDNISTGDNTSTDETQINATFIRYDE
jgi:hypothetical protein